LAVTHLYRCDDYLRLYLDVDAADVLTSTTPWSYELCGNISALPMKQFYSSRQALAMRFRSDSVRGNHTGFRGIYRFVDRGRSAGLFTFPLPLLCMRSSPSRAVRPRGRR